MTDALKKPPVVMIHGMWSTPDTLHELKVVFEQLGHTVHAPRLPHHYPKSEMTDAAKASLAVATLDEYVTSVVNFINSLDEKPIVVGHSMGALIAQLVAVKVDPPKLILISSAAPAGINGWSMSVIRTFGRNLLKFPLWMKTTDLLLRNIQYGIAHRQSLKLHQEIADESTFESGRASTEIGMWFFLPNPSSKVDFNRITCPVLIIAGTADRITPVSIQRKIARKFASQATLKEIQDCDHWTIGGRYLPQIAETIREWLGGTQLHAIESIESQAAA